MKKKLIIAVSVAVAWAAFTPVNSRAQNASSTSTWQSDSTATAPSLKVPTPVEEIVQLSKSGVGDAVIVDYIQNSDRPYRLSAQDIINLRDQGVSTEVTTALIRRGAEQRQAAEEAQKKAEAEAATVAAAPTYQTQPTTQVVQTSPTVVYYPQPRSTVSVHYFGVPQSTYRNVYYPYYRSYVPTYYGPRVSFGVGFGGHRYPHSFRSGFRHCR